MTRFVPLALLLWLPTAAAQVVSVHVGGADFDLSGTGQAALVDVRLTHPLGRYVAVEGGLGLTATDQQFGDVTYLLPNAEVQVGVPIGSIARPFLGLGLGAFLPVADSGPQPGPFGQTVDSFDPDADAVATFALGVDSRVSGPWGVRVSARLRATLFGGGPDVFSSTFTEVTGGVTYRL